MKNDTNKNTQYQESSNYNSANVNVQNTTQLLAEQKSLDIGGKKK